MTSAVRVSELTSSRALRAQGGGRFLPLERWRQQTYRYRIRRPNSSCSQKTEKQD